MVLIVIGRSNMKVIYTFHIYLVLWLIASYLFVFNRLIGVKTNANKYIQFSRLEKLGFNSELFVWIDLLNIYPNCVNMWISLKTTCLAPTLNPFSDSLGNILNEYSNIFNEYEQSCFIVACTPWIHRISFVSWKEHSSKLYYL